LAQELSSYEGQSGHLYSTGSRIPAKASAITDKSEELAYWMAQTKASDPDPTEKSRPSADCAVIESRRDNSRLDDEMKEWFYSYQPSEFHQEGYDKAITIHSRQISFNKSARSRRSLEEEEVLDPITAVASEKQTLTADEQKQDESVGQPAEEKTFADCFHPAYLEDRLNRREETAAERQRDENSDNESKSASGAAEEVPSELESPALRFDRSSLLLEECGTTQAVCDEFASLYNDTLLIPIGPHELESGSIDSTAAELKNLALQQTGDLIGVRRLTENRGKAVAHEDEYCLHNDVDQLSRGQPVTADRHMVEPDEDSHSTSGVDQELDSDQSSSIVLYNRSSPLLEDNIAPTDLLREDNHHSDYEERQTEKHAAATGHWKRSASPIATEEHPTDNHTQEHAFAQESTNEEERSITTENAECIERTEDSSGADKEILSDLSSSEGVVTYDQSSPLLDDYDIIGNIYSDEEDDNLLHQHAQLNSLMPTYAEQPTSSRLLEEEVGMTLLQNQQKISDQWARPPSPPARTEDYVEDISSQTAQQHEQEMLTQEELDHIAYIQRLAEESSAVVALPPRPPPPSVTAEHKHEEKDEFGLPRYAEPIEHEREPSEKSEATSGADEGVLSDVYEEHAFEEKP
uniref:Microtubule-associated protein futsch n=1 Tax=Heligmosomoides polygyrus TaxID=6339 RepID=A0A183FAW2_HELPZ